MALHRPRRIFRGSALDLAGFGPGRLRSAGYGPASPGLPGLGGLLRGGVLAALAAGGIGAGVLLFGQSSELFGRAPAPAGAVAAAPMDVAVVDGGTLRLHDTVVRLHGVAAPARGHTCPDGLGAGYDGGAAASAALANLVRDRRVACQLNGRDPSGLVQGVCEAAGTEINRALVATGWARADGPALGAAEAAARTSRLGLWRNGANPGF